MRKKKICLGAANILLIIYALICIIPFFLLISASFSDNAAIVSYGYSFIPKKFSLEAYRYLWKEGSKVLRAIGISFFITIVGTAASLLITTLLGYPLSRKEFCFRKPLSFVVFFTLLFNGGMVPTYLIYTKIFHINDTIWALIIPGLLMNGFNVMLMRTYFETGIPNEIIEAARVDGLSEFGILRRIVVPVSRPIFATIGLLTGVSYWNDWYNALMYISKPELYSLQVMLSKIMQNIQFLANNTSLAGQRTGSSMSIPSTTARMAIAVAGIVPIIIIYPFFQKYFEKGVAVGAVKG